MHYVVMALILGCLTCICGHAMFSRAVWNVNVMFHVFVSCIVVLYIEFVQMHIFFAIYKYVISF
jgi:hypothetical protein